MIDGAEIDRRNGFPYQTGEKARKVCFVWKEIVVISLNYRYDQSFPCLYWFKERPSSMYIYRLPPPPPPIDRNSVPRTIKPTKTRCTIFRRFFPCFCPEQQARRTNDKDMFEPNSQSLSTRLGGNIFFLSSLLFESGWGQSSHPGLKGKFREPDRGLVCR